MKAICFGINYPGSMNALRGCCADAAALAAKMLACGCDIEDICLMIDDLRLDTSISSVAKNALFTGSKQVEIVRPTKLNILKKIRKCCEDNSVECLFISGACHGTRTQDKNSDEIGDGKDEVIICASTNPNNPDNIEYLIDDEIFDCINNACNKRTKPLWICAMIDCCHSATSFDLPYVMQMINGQDNKRYLTVRDHMKNGRTIDNPLVVCCCISGCCDVQTAGEFPYNGLWRGRASLAFELALNKLCIGKENPDLTYFDIYGDMVNTLLDMQDGKVNLNYGTQLINYSSCKKIDVNRSSHNIKSYRFPIGAADPGAMIVDNDTMRTVDLGDCQYVSEEEFISSVEEGSGSSGLLGSGFHPFSTGPNAPLICDFDRVQSIMVSAGLCFIVLCLLYGLSGAM